MDTPVRPGSLTEHLARAAAATADAHRVDLTAVDEEKADGPRCAASVLSGQRCNRLAAEGDTLCLGHIAMAGDSAVPLMRTQ